MKGSKSSLRVVFSILVACPVISAVAADSGFYVGTDVGRSSYPRQGHVTLEFPGDTLTSSDLHTHDFAVRLEGGYRFNRYFAADVSYVNFGKVTGQLNSVSDNVSGQGRFDYCISGATFGLVGTLPFGKWEAFARLDYLVARVRLSSSAQTGVDSFTYRASERSTAALKGLGLRYNFTDHYSVKLEIEHAGPVGKTHEAGRAAVNAPLLGFDYRF